MPQTETINDEVRPWPYFKPYGLVERPIQKPKRRRAKMAMLKKIKPSKKERA